MYYLLLFSMIAISVIVGGPTGDDTTTPGNTETPATPTTPAKTEWCEEGVWTLCCKGDLPENPTTVTIPECTPVTTAEECPAEPGDNWDSDSNKMYCCDTYTLPETMAEKGTGDGCSPLSPQPNWDPNWDHVPHDPLGAPSYIKGVPATGAAPGVQGLRSAGQNDGGVLEGLSENIGGFIKGASENTLGFFRGLGTILNIGNGKKGANP